MLNRGTCPPQPHPNTLTGGGPLSPPRFSQRVDHDEAPPGAVLRGRRPASRWATRSVGYRDVKARAIHPQPDGETAASMDHGVGGQFGDYQLRVVCQVCGAQPVQSVFGETPGLPGLVEVGLKGTSCLGIGRGAPPVIGRHNLRLPAGRSFMRVRITISDGTLAPSGHSLPRASSPVECAASPPSAFDGAIPPSSRELLRRSAS